MFKSIALLILATLSLNAAAADEGKVKAAVQGNLRS